MFCLRPRAMPSLRAPVSSTMNRISQFTQQPTSRAFSSFLTTPTRHFQPMQRSFPTMPATPTTTITTSTTPSITSLLAQQSLGQSQTRSFSASASLGVRRVTFRPSRRVQKRRHGFLSRNKTQKGRQTINHRRLKGRKNVSW
ncbi:Ribosomal protein L34 [Penicillium sp. IBT 16267x]|nr:Ribosomal protein L34 [Penicillium sp. IBT 16267x]